MNAVSIKSEIGGEHQQISRVNIENSWSESEGWFF